MKNVQISLDGNTMTIVVDISKEFGASSSGKTTIIATTSGNMAVDESGDPPVMVGLNVYRKIAKG